MLKMRNEDNITTAGLRDAGRKYARTEFEKMAAMRLRVRRRRRRKGEDAEFWKGCDAGAEIWYRQDSSQHQYLWKATIQPIESNGTISGWNSTDDFAKESDAQLDPWERLAQVLLCTNEFLFVD